MSIIEKDLKKSFQVVHSDVKDDDQRYLDFRSKWEHHTKTLQLSDKPLHVDIEATNACNLRCAMCERNKMKRPVGLMDFKLFTNIIDQCVEQGIYSVKLNLWGESLVHPQIFDMIDYAHKNKVHTQFNTNTNFITEEVSDKMIASGLDRVTFSIESIHKDIYEATRIGNKFEKVMRNIEYFITNKPVGKKPYLTIQFLRMKKNYQYLDQYVEHFKGRVDFISVTNVSSLTDDPEILQEAMIDYRQYPKMPCASLWQRLSIYWNGDVTVCCTDADGYLTIGNIREKSLVELWHSDEMNKLRKKHKQCDFSNMICQECTLNHKVV